MAPACAESSGTRWSHCLQRVPSPQTNERAGVPLEVVRPLRITNQSSGSNVIPRRVRPGLAGLRPHTKGRPLTIRVELRTGAQRIRLWLGGGWGAYFSGVAWIFQHISSKKVQKKERDAGCGWSTTSMQTCVWSASLQGVRISSDESRALGCGACSDIFCG